MHTHTYTHTKTYTHTHTHTQIHTHIHTRHTHTHTHTHRHTHTHTHKHKHTHTHTNTHTTTFVSLCVKVSLSYATHRSRHTSRYRGRLTPVCPLTSGTLRDYPPPPHVCRTPHTHRQAIHCLPVCGTARRVTTTIRRYRWEAVPSPSRHKSDITWIPEDLALTSSPNR